jgi:hypothetical protein
MGEIPVTGYSPNNPPPDALPDAAPTAQTISVPETDIVSTSPPATTPKTADSGGDWSLLLIGGGALLALVAFSKGSKRKAA